MKLAQQYTLRLVLCLATAVAIATVQAAVYVLYLRAEPFAVSLGSEALHRQHRHIVETGLWITSGLIVLAALLLWRARRDFYHAVSLPLRDLSQALRRFADGDRQATFAHPHSDEVGDLARAFSEMKRKINRAFNDLEVKSERLERFSSVAAHDLRAPLATIRSYVDLLEDAHLEPEERSRAVRAVRGTVERSLKLVSGLLAYARSRSWAPQIAALEARKAVTHALADLSAEIRERGCEIRVDPLGEVHADEGLLNELIRNLLDNAIKYARPGIPPRVRVSWREARREGKVYDEILINDNGRGFKPEQKTRIFEAFQRLDRSQDVCGFGLGLAICSQIMHSHKGYIDVASAEGVGSTFRVGFPRGAACSADQRDDRSGEERSERASDQGLH